MNQTILPKSWEVPDTICQRMGQGVGRQRLLTEGENHMLVLHQIPFEDDRGVRLARIEEDGD